MDAITRAIELAGGPTVVACVLSVSPQAVYFWRKGERSLPVEHCTPLERMSGFAVMRWDLRPADWHRIWPELIGTEGAPPVPTDPPAAQEAA